MPFIELPKKRTNKDRGYKPQPNSGNEWAKECYNTDTWRRIRHAYLMENPLCEIHSAMGMVKAAEEVHHINHISNAGSRLEAHDIAFDSSNLMALCKRCHMHYHGLVESHRYLSKEDKEFMQTYNELVKNKHKEQC